MVEPELLGELGIEEFTEEFFSDEAIKARENIVESSVVPTVTASSSSDSNDNLRATGVGCSILPVLLIVFILLVVVIAV